MNTNRCGVHSPFLNLNIVQSSTTKPYLSAMSQCWQRCVVLSPLSALWFILAACGSSYLYGPPCPVVRVSCCDACMLHAPWNTQWSLGHDDSMTIDYSGSILTSNIDFKRWMQALRSSRCCGSRTIERECSYTYSLTLYLITSKT